MEPTGDTSTSTLDLEAASDRIGASLFQDLSEPKETPGLAGPATTEPSITERPVASADQPIATAPSPKVYEVPKSWKKEMHEHWGKITPEAQAYVIEREQQLLNGFQQFAPIRDALAPHLDYLTRNNVQAPYAINALLNAHRALTEGPLEQRQAYYKQLGEELKVLQGQASTPATPVDPTIQQLQQKLNTLESTLKQWSQQELAAVQADVAKEVDAFAADTKAHPYFDEVATDIAAFISQGQSLQDAYEKAVWANPVTRAKEQARILTEHEAKLKENARLASLPKKKAASVNLSSASDGKAPTEPVGSLEDTIRSTLKEIRQRAS